MQQRPNPRTIPDTDTYVAVDLGSRGQHHLRIPSPLVGAKLLKAVDSRTVAALASLGSLDPTDPSGVVAVVRGAGPEILSVAGYVVAASWFHRDTDLETVADPKDPMGSGERAVEEMHEGGYRLGDLLVLALVVLREWMARNSLNEEVAERLGFSSRTPGSTSSASSTSSSTSSTASAVEPSVT